MTRNDILERLLGIEIAVENGINLDDKNWLARAFFEIKQLESDLAADDEPTITTQVDTLTTSEATPA